MKKKVPLTAEQVRLLARRAIVDEYGDLLVQLMPHKAAFARLEAVKKTIRAWFADSDAAETFVAHGDHYEATLGPKGNQTVIEDMQAVYEAMGHDVFIAACSMTIESLGKLAGSHTIVVQTGSRPLTVSEPPE